MANLGWQKMRRTEGHLVPVLLEHAKRYYDEEAIVEAWDEFTLWNDVPMDMESEPELDSPFTPWFLFNWVPDNTGVDSSEHYPEMPVALHYLEQQGTGVDSYRRRFIEEACAQPYSFFMAQEVVPGQQMTLKDLMLEQEVTVHERKATTMVRESDILFTRVISLDGNAIMFGAAPLIIPADYLEGFITTREMLKEKPGGLNQTTLHDHGAELRATYYDIREQAKNPAMPVLHNTDGDLYQLTQIIYQLHCTPREALGAMASLTLSEVDDVIYGGTFDKNGELVAIEFPWLKKGNSKHSTWDNTLMGDIKIDGTKMTIDVNSQQRADEIKRKVARRLGKRGLFQNAVIQSTEKMFEEMRNRPTGQSTADAKEVEDLNALPEVQAHLREMGKMHWKDWLDQPIPALKDQTPREAAKTKAGRERLEALLLLFESRIGDPPQPFDPDIDDLRRSLGLD